MKKVLVVYFTQTGQLKQIIDSALSPLENNPDVQVTYEQLRPVAGYSFPWKSVEFFDVFPESVEGIPCGLRTCSFDPDDDYDLVVLAYQVWYLSPSIPFASFLKTPEARQLIGGKNVITLLGVRNMWVMAQEKVKNVVHGYGGKLVGNIVFFDRAPNLISIITIMKWMSTGNKGPYKYLPGSGVSKEDIREAARFGCTILEALQKDRFNDLQKRLVSDGAVNLDYALIRMEKTGVRIFKKWAKFILAKGTQGDPNRLFRVRLFRIYLIFAVYTLSPVISLIFYFFRFFFKETTERQMNYYYGTTPKA
ncbi:MAG: dialkylresorcinol condensing enzyme DarA [Thermodesulfobacteriota bacterium]|nr:dialkylresorcinol condensing enzyme DarA [Thermodesulfobacteriota bacterium]